MNSKDRARDELLERIERDRIVIPPVPAVFDELGRLLQEAEVGTQEVAAAVAKDPPLSSLVLRVANSARYSPREKIVSVEKACVMLGGRGIRNLVLQVGARRSFEHLHARASEVLKGFWRHALLTARLAVRLEGLCEYEHDIPVDLLYTCGLLHDIGQLVLLDAFGDDYVALLDTARSTGKDVYEVEREQHGYSHTEVGALLATKWSLPEEIVTTLGHHHDDAIQCLRHPWLALTDLANRLAVALEQPKHPAAWTFLDPNTAQRLGLHVSKIEEVLEWGESARSEISDQGH